jgi:predicted TIM-barrel fold metal-dependent hydrolase
MTLDLNWMVSVDDHVLEPGHVWQDRVPSRYRDQAPRLVRSAEGEFWFYEDKRLPTFGLSAVAGKRAEEFSLKPITYDEMRPGCYDPVARLDDMNRAGVLASMCFPSFPRFCGQTFYEASDRELALLCVKAYNDFMIDEWCGSAPGRYIPLIIVPLWDPYEAAREVERCAAKGSHAITFSENPAPLGLPTVHSESRYWDPLWAVAEETESVICMHIGSSSQIPTTSKEAPFMVTLAWASATSVSGALLDWLFSGVFQRFPGLKIALSEGGIGWIPYFLERAQQVVDKQRFWAARGDTKIDVRTGALSEGTAGSVDFENFDVHQIFRDHVYGCFIDDIHGLQNIEAIGIDNVMTESDYPHSDSTWPDCIELAGKRLAGFSDTDAYKILRGNAERVFQFTPAAPPAL